MTTDYYVTTLSNGCYALIEQQSFVATGRVHSKTILRSSFDDLDALTAEAMELNAR